RRECITEPFTEGHTQIKPVTQAMLAADAVEAREIVLEIMTILVRDDVLVELLGVGGEIPIQRDQLRASLYAEVRTAGLAAPVHHQRRQVGRRLDTGDCLDRGVDGVENRE